MPRPSLAVIISTIEENLDSFITHFSFKNLKNADEVIIVIQGLKEKSVIPELSSFKIIISFILIYFFMLIKLKTS